MQSRGSKLNKISIDSPQMSLGYKPQDMWLRRSMEESDSGHDDPSPHQRTSGAVNPSSRHPFIPRTRVGTNRFSGEVQHRHSVAGG